MKRILLIMFAFGLTQTFAQDKSFLGNLWERIHFGLKAGGNYSNFSNATFDAKWLPGFHAGGIVTFDMAKRLVVQEEFLYSTKGAKVNKGLFGKEDVKLDYLSVPILFKYRSVIGLYAELGTQADLLLSDHKLPDNEAFAEKLDFGLVGGLGYHTRHFEIGTRYYYGMKNTGKFENVSVAKDFKNISAQLSLSYFF